MNKVVSIDIDSHFIKAVAVRRKGSKAVVSSCARTARTQDDISIDLDNLLKGKDFSSGAAIVVTDNVKFLASELSGMPGKGKISEDVLLSAAAWEMEPYLDFPVAEGLFACQARESETKGNAAPVLISAASRKIYSELSNALKKFGLTLYRAYSPEGGFTTVSSFPVGKKNRIVIDCRQDSVKGALFLPTGPSAFQSRALGSVGLEQAVEDVIHSLKADAGVSAEIIIAGDGTVNDLIEALKPEFKDIRRWELRDALAEISVVSGVNLSSEYATAVGAAAQELGLAGKAPFGITDRVSFIKSFLKKTGEDKRFLFAVVLIPLIFSIAGHCAVTRLSLTRRMAAVRLLKKEKEKLLKPMKKKANLKARIKASRQKMDYLKKTLPARQRNLISAFSAISGLRPPDIVLTGFSQEREGVFIIEGDALYAEPVTHFKNKLSGLKFCEEVIIETLNAEETKGKKFFPCHFVINLRFTRE